MQVEVYKIMKMQMFTTLDKANKGISLAEVKHRTIQVTTLPRSGSY
jgi:hypothetical protein